jgi:hypothetical protein
MNTLSHGPSAIGNGCNNLACFLLSVDFVGNQANLHVFFYIIFQIRPIIGLLENCCGALCTTMASKWPIMAFLQKHIFKPPF